MGAEHPNLGPHTCAPSSLPAEPLQPIRNGLKCRQRIDLSSCYSLDWWHSPCHQNVTVFDCLQLFPSSIKFEIIEQSSKSQALVGSDRDMGGMGAGES